MKRIFFGIALMLCSITALSQVPPFVGFTPVPNPPSTSTNTTNPFQIWEMERQAQIMAVERQASQNAKTKREVMLAIREMKQYIINALGQDIDETLRKQLNEDYVALSKIAENIQNYGFKDEYIDKLLWISDNINNNIVSFINRTAESQINEVETKPQKWTGTGFALNYRYVATNYHVVEDAKTLSVTGINGNFNIHYSASVVASDKVNDLAIVRINDSRFNGFGTLPYGVDIQIAEVGENVFVLGYPLTQTMGSEIKLTNGIISSRTGFQGDASLYQMTAPIQPGNSGGPMFNSKGNVIGVVCAHHAGAENAGYAIKTSYLKNLADSYSLYGIFPTCTNNSRLTLSEQVKRLKQYVFLIECSR